MHSSTVPVTITPDAAARVAELGMQAELEQMIEHTRQIVPGLQSLEVVLVERYDLGGEPGITIRALTTLFPPERVEDQWGSWQVRAFPGRVCEHFAMLTYPVE